MNPEEYENLDQVERDHWYYSGKRLIAARWLGKIGEIRPSSLLADCGAGTGAFALEMSRRCRVVAIDDHQESLDLLRRRLPEESVLQGSCTALPLEDGSCDFVSALDVLEHIEDDHRALREIWRVIKPGGGLVVTVPALMSLWSDWDVSLRHFRRYDRKGLLKLVQTVSPEIIECNYMNFFAFPAVWTLRRLRGSRAENSVRAEDRVPPAAINRMLKSVFVRSSCQQLVRWPFGVGLLCVLRKIR